jgi:hypothetical protein
MCVLVRTTQMCTLAAATSTADAIAADDDLAAITAGAIAAISAVATADIPAAALSVLGRVHTHRNT